MIIFRLIFESLRFAMQALMANLMRTILSLLGVTIGIFAIIAVLTVVDSLEKSIKDSMAFLGTNVIYVQKWPWSFVPNYPWWNYLNRPVVDEDEFRFMEKHLTTASGVAMSARRGGNILKNGSNSREGVSLLGVTYQYNKVADVPIVTGRYFSQQDITNAKPVAVIGAEVAATLFPRQDPEGKEFKVRGRKFVVIGIMEKQGASLLGTPSIDETVYVPFGAFRLMFHTGRTGVEPELTLKGFEEDKGLLELESEARGYMRSVRSLKPRDEDDFALNRPEMIADKIGTAFDVIGFAGWVIGSFSILVGGFGIANIMFVSVKERTNIIGIQKSLGAKNYFILFQFLFEAVFLSVIGGGLGLLLVFLCTFIPLGDFVLFMSMENIVIGLTISSSIGVIAGIVPAIAASRLDPVEAIRA